MHVLRNAFRALFSQTYWRENVRENVSEARSENSFVDRVHLRDMSNATCAVCLLDVLDIS